MNITRFTGMNVLVLSPTPTYPLDYGNRKRVYSVCKQLQDQGAVVHFLYYPSENDWRESLPDDDIKVLQQQWASFTLVPPSIDLHAYPQGEDHVIDEWWDPSIENTLSWMFKAKKFDAFIVNYTWLSKALTFAPESTVKVLDTHDKFSGRRSLLELNGIGKEFFHTTEDEEKIALDRANIVWAIKEQEGMFFNELTQTPKVKTLIHCDPEQTPCKAQDYPKLPCLRVGIFGARNNINVVNTRNFLELALPLCKSALAPIQFILAGTMCHDLDYPNDVWIENLGYVRDVASFYNAVDLVVIPMTFSSGLKIKVAEAFARSVPVLCHEHASEGYPVTTYEHRMTSLNSMIDRLIELSFDPSQLDWLAGESVKAHKACSAAFAKPFGHLASTIKHSSVVTLAIVEANRLTANDLVCIRLRELFDFLPYAAKSILVVIGEESDHRLTTIFKNKSSVYFANDAAAANEVIGLWEPDLCWLMSDIANLSLPKNSQVFYDQLSFLKADNIVESKCNSLVTSWFNENTNPNGFDKIVALPIFNWRLSKKALPRFSPYNEGGKVIVFNDGSKIVRTLLKLLSVMVQSEQVFEILEHDRLKPVTQQWIYADKIVSNISNLPKGLATLICRNKHKLPSWVIEFIDRSDVHLTSLEGVYSVNALIDVIETVRSGSAPDEVNHTSYASDAGWAYLWDVISKDLQKEKEIERLFA